jgi:hypothetical protein
MANSSVPSLAGAGVPVGGTAGQVLAKADATDYNFEWVSTSLRVITLTDAATVTPDADSTDIGVLTSLSQNTTIASPTGTPLTFQSLRLRIKSSSVRTLTWGTAYRGSTDMSLPAETSGSNLTDYMTFWYNTADSKWDFLGKNFGF